MVERTTVRLSGELLGRARRKASEEGRTLTSLIEDGLRLVVADGGKRTSVERTRPRVSEAHGGLLPGIDLTKTAALQEIDDAEHLRRIAGSE